MAKSVKSQIPMMLQTVMKSAEDKLSKAGFRLTQPRQEILRVFLESKKPLKIAEVFEIVNHSSKIDRVSTYRIVEVFKKLGLIHVVGDSGFVFCSHIQEKEDAHLYLVCEKCHTVEEIDLPQKIKNTLADQVQNQAQFKSRGSIQINGLCSDCN